MDKNKIDIEHPTIIENKLTSFSYFQNTNITIPRYNGKDLNHFIDIFEKDLSNEINQSFYGLVEFKIESNGNIINKKVISSNQKFNPIVKKILVPRPSTFYLFSATPSGLLMRDYSLQNTNNCLFRGALPSP